MWNKGFTIIELLIVLALISMLSALAFTSYQHMILKAHHLDAQTTLLDYHTRMQHCFISTHHYEVCAVTLGLSGPVNSMQGFYRIQMGDLTEYSYSLQGEAQGIQKKDDACYFFAINHLQERWAFTEGGERNNKCW